MSDIWHDQKPADKSQFRSFLRQVKEIDPKLYYVINNSLMDFSGSSHAGARIAAQYHEATPRRSVNQKVVRRDPCSLHYAGKGAQSRFRCRDAISKQVYGPELVVIKGTDKLASFAIGRKEVSVVEFNIYCKWTNACVSLPQSNLPVTNISLRQALGYTQWLAKMTGKPYRLPNQQEWELYSKDDSGIEDHNCLIQTGGRTIRGNELRATSKGYQNSLGLLNQVGNASEWVNSASGYVAKGGSAVHSIQSCATNTLTASLGPDPFVGFRLVRSLNF